MECRGQDSHTNLVGWSKKEQACEQSNDFSCAVHEDAKAAPYMSAFAGQVRAMSLPPAAAPAVAKVVADATASAQGLIALSRTTSVAQYASVTASTGVVQHLTGLQTDIASAEAR